MQLSFCRKYYGLLGLLIIAIMVLAALFNIPYADQWVTAFGWYGYIIFFDWLNYRQKGRSLITTDTANFLLMLPASVGLWCVFELHNLRFGNWEYFGLPSNKYVAYVGCVIAFSTILPGLYETFDFLQGRRRQCWQISPHAYGKARLLFEIILGLVFICIATFFPSTYTGPLIWPGYFFVFSPLNYLLGLPSVLKEREEGRISQTVDLLMAGYICGLFWEFLNYWAQAKWIYHVPYFAHLKYFEMPLLGFLGFGPFAIAFVEMYRFLIGLPTRLARRIVLTMT